MNKKELEKRVENTLKHEKASIEALQKSISKDFYDAVGALDARDGKIIVTGVGKSGFIGMKMAATFTSLGHGAFFLNPMDALHGDAGMIDDGDVLIALSFSGNTSELLRLIKYTKKAFNIKNIAITGNTESELAKLSDHTIQIFVDDEGCPLGLAPMASTTASLVVGDLLASALTSPEIFNDEHFAKYHPAGTLGLKLRKVGEILRKEQNTPRISEGSTVSSALDAITEGGLGVVAVVDEKEKLVGIITDGDVRRILIENDNPKELKVKKVMSTSPKHIAESDTFMDAMFKMEEYKITNLFVVDSKNTLVGLIHIHDILEASM